MDNIRSVLRSEGSRSVVTGSVQKSVVVAIVFYVLPYACVKAVAWLPIEVYVCWLRHCSWELFDYSAVEGWGFVAAVYDSLVFGAVF